MGKGMRILQNYAVFKHIKKVTADKKKNRIRWCYHCKHEIPEYLNIDVCDLCGGDVVEIGEKA